MEALMEALFLVGQLLSLCLLAYGVWLSYGARHSVDYRPWF